jgi:uncharacterized protein YeaO (DUF488 family)
MTIKIKRAYEPYTKTDGYRVLVDRLWPRGIKKEGAHINLWLKDVSPSTGLRKWFNHEPEKWKEFVTKYKAELKEAAALEQLIAVTKEHKTITLVYGAKEERYNQAVVLQNLLLKKND